MSHLAVTVMLKKLNNKIDHRNVINTKLWHVTCPTPFGLWTE